MHKAHCGSWIVDRGVNRTRGALKRGVGAERPSATRGALKWGVGAERPSPTHGAQKTRGGCRASIGHAWSRRVDAWTRGHINFLIFFSSFLR